MRNTVCKNYEVALNYDSEELFNISFGWEVGQFWESFGDLS